MKGKHNFIRYLSTTLALLLFLILAPTIQAEASDVEVLLSGDDLSEGETRYSEGVSPSRSGWVVYVIDAHGNRVSPDAKLVSSNGYTFNESSEAMWNCTTRIGGYSVNKSTACLTDAQWGAPFEGSFRTRESAIREYMRDSSDGVPNAYKLVQFYWGTDIVQKWANEDCYFVLEPFYEYRIWFKYSVEVTQAGSGTRTCNYQSKSNAPILCGNVSGLATLSNSFLSSLGSRNKETDMPYAGVHLKYTYKTGFAESGMVSAYAKAFPRMEYLPRSICGIPAGSAGSGYLSLSQIQNAGWGILAISAHDSGTPTPTDTPDTPSPDSYDGYFYTLSCTGGSGSTSASATFGGTFYAESSASGDDAYSLASSKASGLSYTGSVPSVIFFL